MANRALSSQFIDEIKKGKYSDILQYVILDDTLDMELRGSYVTIYYRGASILIIDEKDGLKILSDSYNAELNNANNIEEYFPKAKHSIDKYVRTVRNHLWEKEIQQQIVRENNYSPNADGTDYFIVDIEYVEDDYRFDIVALRWDSTSTAHKLTKNTKLKISIFEIKQGENSVDGSSGLNKHIVDFNKLNRAPLSFINDMTNVFFQKRYLGLIPSADELKNIDISSVSDELQFIAIVVNNKSASTRLRKELESIETECNLIYSNAMGYGLYSKNIISKEEFIEYFKLCK